MKSYSIAVLWLLVFLLAAHAAAPAEYEWAQHNISQLGAQGYARAWIMRAGFIGFGLWMLLIGSGRIRRNASGWYRDVLLMLYGLGILLTGFFSDAPFIAGAPFSEQEAATHSLLATAAGVSLSAAILAFALTDPVPGSRILHIAALVLVTGLSAAFGALPAWAGVLQRLLWLAGLTWLGACTSDGRLKTASRQPRAG